MTDNKRLKILVDSKMEKFVICDPKSDKIKTIISPFITTVDEDSNPAFHSGMVLPTSRIQRAQGIFQKIPEICKIDVVDGKIFFDCVTEIMERFYANLKSLNESGLISFSYNFDEKNKKIIINKRKLFIESFSEKYNVDVKPINFTTEKLKILPVMLENGFIVTIAQPNEELTTFISVQNPEENFVDNYDISSNSLIFSYLLNIWGGDIFRIKMKDDIGRLLIRSDICSELHEGNQSMILKLTRKSSSDVAYIEKIYEEFID